MKLQEKSPRLIEYLHKAGMQELVNRDILIDDSIIDHYRSEIEHRHPDWTKHEQQERAVLRALAQITMKPVEVQNVPPPQVIREFSTSTWDKLWKVGILLLLGAQLALGQVASNPKLQHVALLQGPASSSLILEIQDEGTALDFFAVFGTINFTGAGVTCTTLNSVITCNIVTSGGTSHDILSATHTDALAAAVSRGSLIVGQTATPVWQELVIGAANTFLGSDGTDGTWTALADAHIPDTITASSYLPLAGGTMTGDLQLLDNSAAEFGSGSDSRLYYNGTDTFWDLRAAGTGDLMIALAGSFPSPDPGVHIWRGNAGAVTAISNAGLVIENSAATYIHFLTPNSNTSGILWGDPEADIAGGLIYNHSTDALNFRLVDNTNRLLYSANTFAFQEATTVSTPVNTDLTLSNSGTGNIILTPGGTVTMPTPFTLGAVSVLPTGTELNFVDGVTSAIQTQLDLKAPLISPSFTTPALGTPASGVMTNVTGIPAGAFVAAAVDGDDVNSNIAGRSLTLTAASPDTLDADAELYVFKSKIAFEDPVATDDFFFEEIATTVTFSSIYCKTLVGTVNLDVQIAGVDINGSDIICTTSGVLDSSLGGDTAGAVGEELKLAITSVATVPTYLLVQVNGTLDD